MKKTIIYDLEPGDTFRWGKVNFILLENKEPGDEAVCITKEIPKKECVPFDKKCRTDRNNLRGSDMLESLENWLSCVFDLETVDADDVLYFEIDLTSVDGTTGYPPIRTYIGLLTFDEYRKYRRLIPLVSSWWSLASPWTQVPGCTGISCHVGQGGVVNSDVSYNPVYAIRPVLHLRSSTIVFVDGEDEEDEEQTPEQREMALYEGAVEKFGTHAQILMAVEEMSELTKALLKYIRHEDFGQGNKDTVLQSIAEERADVSIMLSQLDVIFGDNSEMECEKLKRLEELLNG